MSVPATSVPAHRSARALELPAARDAARTAAAEADLTLGLPDDPMPVFDEDLVAVPGEALAADDADREPGPFDDPAGAAPGGVAPGLLADATDPIRPALGRNGTGVTAADLAVHRPALLRFARRKVRDEALAEDAVQDALLAALGSVDRFQGQSALRTWLIGILNHKIQDVFRRETRYVTMSGDDDDRDPFDRLGADEIDDSDDPMRAVAGARMRAALEREIEGLPPTLKDVFRMQALEGVSTPQVCEKLSISEANCWVRLHRARKLLASRMRDHL